ncbi:hypothetical protein PIB30_069896 [Stylosanthes scabra]|uniref:Uncharacterized protein n=1 Tax=Stylosanthes scabra TaxID=79078 RepID=A0ABU6TQP1_9FABA|nr:hypothetical protein [Stylosanthes scabra]
MADDKKLVILFVLIIATTLASPIHPQEVEDEFDEENMSPYYYDIRNPSVAPLPSIDIEAPNSEYYDNSDDDIDQHLYDSSPSSSAPSPGPGPAGFMSSGSEDDGVVSPRPPVLPFNYTAEDDAGEITNENFQHVEEQNMITCGILIGIVCLVGLGGAFVYKRKIYQKRKQYQHLFNNKRGDI